MLVITSILAGGVYPWVIQQFQVRPSEQTLEEQYIERNISMTRRRTAWKDPGDAVQRHHRRHPGALAPDAQTTANIRLLDPNLISDAFSQLEQFRPYYQFPDASTWTGTRSTARSRTQSSRSASSTRTA